MGCGAAKATKTCETPNMDEKVPKPVAFEIPLDPVITSDNGSEDMSKKQPPKRLARLEEQRLSIPTAEELEERLQKAEERRQEIIDEKVQKSRAFQAKILGERTSNASDENNSEKKEEKETDEKKNEVEKEG
ncbi:uncharacterized protein LOC141858770 isoform X2 [Brevipalpus obovatus]|uniref:uncharacterized protein LOC141858770 isoform X2 n=1 Tax=Brevipalpus obovatus TaxID=246614 RepID=UPI003D9E6987